MSMRGGRFQSLAFQKFLGGNHVNVRGALSISGVSVVNVRGASGISRKFRKRGGQIHHPAPPLNESLVSRCSPFLENNYVRT